MAPEVNLEAFKTSLTQFLTLGDEQKQIMQNRWKDKMPSAEDRVIMIQDYTDGLHKLAEVGPEFAAKADIFSYGVLVLQVGSCAVTWPGLMSAHLLGSTK